MQNVRVSTSYERSDSTTIAELHGKLPTLEAKEDLLTSDVFSAFRYLPLNIGLIPFLGKAINVRSGQPISNIFTDCLTTDYVFWPKTTHYKREPDVLLLITRKTNMTMMPIRFTGLTGTRLLMLLKRRLQPKFSTTDNVSCLKIFMLYCSEKDSLLFKGFLLINKGYAKKNGQE